MSFVQFPKPFQHEHPPVRNVNEVFEEELSLAQQASDIVARVVGSWRFIIVQSMLLAIWAVVNVLAIVKQWDPYPFILMNLVLSLQAAYTAPIIMMSQNRQAVRDRIEAHEDYLINQKAEEEVRAILDHLSAQDRALEELHQLVLKIAAANGQT